MRCLHRYAHHHSLRLHDIIIWRFAYDAGRHDAFSTEAHSARDAFALAPPPLFFASTAAHMTMPLARISAGAESYSHFHFSADLFMLAEVRFRYRR